MRAVYGLARGLAGWLAKGAGQLLVAVPQLDASHDCLPILLAQPGQRGVVPLQRLPTDRLFQRADRVSCHFLVQRHVLRPAAGAPHRIPDPVHQGLPQIGLQRAVVPRFEGLYPP